MRKVPFPVTSAPVRDPFDDHLITPENAAFLFFDYQQLYRPCLAGEFRRGSHRS